MSVTVEKIAVSLPKNSVQKLKKFEREFQSSRSQIIKEAVDLWLKVIEHNKIEEKYRKVYSQKNIITESKLLAEEMLEIARQTLPDIRGQNG